MLKNSLKQFTVIICAYNAEERIAKTIESVLMQKNFRELIDKFLLVDNNSSDSTPEIMKEYERRYEGIYYIREEKQGLGYARQAGLRVASTPWIVFIDDDNVLEKNWIVEAARYISFTKDTGAFNGAVVPEFNEKLTEREVERLNLVLGNLACTHLNEGDIDYNQMEHPHGTPFGAGLVIRKEPLDRLADKGWLKLKGRNANRLSSGDDTEMCLYIQKQGLRFGYNPKMLLRHNLPKTRLDEKYLLKLNEGISESAYDLFYNKLGYVLKLRMSVKSLIKCIIILFKYIVCFGDYKKKFKLKLDLYYHRAIIKRGFDF